jgi:hypothetical protein
MSDSENNATSTPKDFIWEPWKTYATEPELLPIDGPPCRNCARWKPIRKFTGAGEFEGVVLCIAREMEHDFSCFRNRKV